MMTDPIADLLTRIRNAIHAGHRKVDVSPSRMKLSIVDILKRDGFIRNYRMYRQDEKGILRIYLKYHGKNSSVIQGIERVGKPSHRVYVSKNEIPKVLDGVGMAILTTSKGVMSDQNARDLKLGGEVLARVW